MQAGVPDPWFQIKDKDGKCLGLSKDGLTVEPHTCDADDKHLFQTIDSAEHPVSLNFDSQCKYTFLKFFCSRFRITLYLKTRKAINACKSTHTLWQKDQ